jgi:hypothetical protein
VRAACAPVLGVIADRYVEAEMDGVMLDWSARARASSLAMSADWVVASVVARLDAPWQPAAPGGSTSILSECAALKCL